MNKLNEAAIAVLLSKGLNLDDVEEIRAALSYKAPPPPPRVRVPLPDQTTHRRGSSWRRRAYSQLVERDGPVCQECGCVERTIWRKAGVFNNDDWGKDEDGRAISRYTVANRSSNLEVDHVLALRDGGTNELDNLWLLCTECHKEKTSAEQSARLREMFAEASK